MKYNKSVPKRAAETCFKFAWKYPLLYNKKE